MVVRVLSSTDPLESSLSSSSSGVGDVLDEGDDEGGRLVLLPAQGRGGADSRLWGDDLMLPLLPLYLSVQLLLHLLVVILLLIGGYHLVVRIVVGVGRRQSAAVS